MIIIKIIGCILVFIAPTSAGFLYSDSLKKRVLELNEMQRLMYELRNEIIYTHSTLPEAFMDISRKSKYYLQDIFREVSILLCTNEVDNVYMAFKKCFGEKRNLLSLKNEDINIIMDLAKSLGQTDIEGQKGIFSLTLENFKKQIEIAESMMSKNVKMYRSLGFFVGAMAVIIII